MPTSTTYLYMLGENLYLNKQLKDAYQVFTSISILDPSNQYVQNYLKLLEENK